VDSLCDNLALVGRRTGTVLLSLGLSLVVAGPVADLGGATVGPRLNLTKLKSCLSRDAFGQQDTTGTRSFSVTLPSLIDQNVNALVVLSGSEPHPSTVTTVITRGRKPSFSERFANIRIDAYVFHENGVKPLPKAMASLTHEVVKDIGSCVATSH
jgi:hypothetical protein